MVILNCGFPLLHVRSQGEGGYPNLNSIFFPTLLTFGFSSRQFLSIVSLQSFSIVSTVFNVFCFILNVTSMVCFQISKYLGPISKCICLDMARLVKTMDYHSGASSNPSRGLQIYNNYLSMLRHSRFFQLDAYYIQVQMHIHLIQ